eukprot:445696-Rhodomonas_salina.2
MITVRPGFPGRVELQRRTDHGSATACQCQCRSASASGWTRDEGVRFRVTVTVTPPAGWLPAARARGGRHWHRGTD